MKKIYLAGPIQHVNDYGKGWRQWLKQNHDLFEWVDPMDKYNTMEEASTEWTEEQIVEDDLEMIDGCDALLVHWDTVPTCGTPMEMFYAFHTRDIPIVVQSTLHPSDISPWLTYHATAIVPTFEEALDTLENIFYEEAVAENA